MQLHHMCDLVGITLSDCCCMSCQLLLVQGKYEQDDDSDYNIQQCIVGTHTSGAAQNYLKIIGATR